MQYWLQFDDYAEQVSGRVFYAIAMQFPGAVEIDGRMAWLNMEFCKD